MSDSADATAVARRVADALEAAGLPYAIGGALALGYWGLARGTHDVDVNVFLDGARFDDAADALERGGVVLDRTSGRTRAAEGTYVRGMVGDVPVDLFMNSITLHESAAKRTKVRPLLDRPVNLLSAEDLVVLKMLFHRGKDLVDVERVVAMRRDDLDRDYVRRWLVETAGEENYRVADWDQIVREVG